MTTEEETDTGEVKDERRVLLIDLSALFWGAWHSSGGDLTSSAKRRTLEAVYACIDFEKDLLVRNEDRLVAICCDSGRSFRKDIDDRYKANRPEKDHATIGELDRIKQTLADDGFLLWAAPTFEADDIIATAAAKAVHLGHPVTIASPDKDLLQILALPGVKALRTHVWKECDADGVVAKFGVKPEQLGDWLALVGDASDNVRGIPGIGEKTATVLLSKYGTLDGIRSCIAKTPNEITPKFVRALQQNEAELVRSRLLVELSYEAPVEFEQIYEKRAKKKKVEEIDMDSTDPKFDGPAPAAASAPAQDVPVPTGTAPAAEAAKPTVAAAVESRMTVIPPNVSYERQLEPQSLGIAFHLAQKLWESKLYLRFPSAEAIAATMIRGRELGVSALQSLELFHIIDGKPVPLAHFLISLAERDPNCEYFMYVGGDATYAEYETKHRKRPEPIKLRYTIEEAVQAGYCQLESPGRDWNAKDGKDHRGQWDKLRPLMLRKTAGVQLARLIYPTATLGLYSYEESGGEVG